MREPSISVEPFGAGRWAVLLLAHGSPERLEDIPEYLLRVRGGRPLPEPAVREVERRYRLIGGGSPLRHWTARQAELLQQRLGVPVRYGMRNWKPYIAEAVDALPPGLDLLVGICLAPHYSRTSAEIYRARMDEALRQLAVPPRACTLRDRWHDEPHLIAAFAERVRAGLSVFEAESGAEVPVILTAHSVPEAAIAAGEPYEREVRETASRVAEACGLKNWRTAFQSQGMTSESWLGPTVKNEIDEIAAQGHRAVFVAPIGFLCDHAEILYDIDIHFRDYARGKGIELRRAPSLNDSPLLIEALASMALAAVSHHYR